MHQQADDHVEPADFKNSEIGYSQGQERAQIVKMKHQQDQGYDLSSVRYGTGRRLPDHLAIQGCADTGLDRRHHPRVVERIPADLHVDWVGERQVMPVTIWDVSTGGVGGHLSPASRVRWYAGAESGRRAVLALCADSVLHGRRLCLPTRLQFPVHGGADETMSDILAAGRTDKRCGNGP